MAIDLSPHHIDPGDDTELPTKLNDMMDAVEAGVNQGLSDIDDNLDTLSAQITTELGAAVDTVEAAGETAVTAAATATTQAGIATTGANNASNSATASANSAATAAEITNISEVQAFTNTLARAVRVAMTAATSGSTGIKTTISTDNAIGDSDFTLILKATPKGYAASSGTRFTAAAASTGSSVDYPTAVFDLSAGNVTPKIAINGVTYSATTTLTSAEFLASRFWVIAVKRNSATADGSVTIYRNEVQFGDPVTISAGTPYDFPGSAFWAICGDQNSRQPCVFYEAILLNRQMLSTDVLNYGKNGPSPADIGKPGNRASQVSFYESDFSAGVNSWSTISAAAPISGNVDGIAGEDNWLSMSRTTVTGPLLARQPSNLEIGVWYEAEVKVYNPSGSGVTHFGTLGEAASAFPCPENTTTVGTFLFLSTLNYAAHGARTAEGDAADVPVSTILYIKEFKLKRLGVVGLWSAEHTQSDTGQALDQIHTSHALLPSSGATRIPQNLRPVIESPSAHSWTATNEIQYVAGNQVLMSSDDSFLVIDVESDTAFDLNVGDGSDADRFVTAYTLSVGKNRLTIANPFNDGTNRKLTVQPASSVTASITVHAEMIKERI